MSNDYRSIARMIPARYRKQILEENLIYKALPSPSDLHMSALIIIWGNFVEPHGTVDRTCPSCLALILQNYRELQPVFITLEKEEALLDL